MNDMTCYNIGVIFGPTLFGQPPVGPDGQPTGDAADTLLQNLVSDVVEDGKTNLTLTFPPGD